MQRTVIQSTEAVLRARRKNKMRSSATRAATRAATRKTLPSPFATCGHNLRNAQTRSAPHVSTAAASGHALCSTEVSAMLLRRVYSFSQDINPDAGIERLTERELQILGLIAEGLTNQQIASRLMLTLPTIKNHVHRVLSKMEVASRAEAVTVYRAKQHGKLHRTGAPTPAEPVSRLG